MDNDNNNNTNKISISHNKDNLHAEFYYTFSSSLFALNLFGNFRFSFCFAWSFRCELPLCSLHSANHFYFDFFVIWKTLSGPSFRQTFCTKMPFDPFSISVNRVPRLKQCDRDRVQWLYWKIKATKIFYCFCLRWVHVFRLWMLNKQTNEYVWIRQVDNLATVCTFDAIE